MHQNKLKTIAGFILFLTLLHTSLILTHSLSKETTPLNVRTNVILWITPWGHRYAPKEFPPWYIPGIIIPYDVRCGICTNNLKLYVNTSLTYLKIFYNISDTIFINFFCERYYPSYKWRGEINEIISPPIDIVGYIKNIVHEGTKVYIGFSEMSACVNDEQCLLKIIEIYQNLHRTFPNASFYYYGSSRDRLDNLIKLYREAELDLIGIDVWKYDYESGKIHLDSGLVEKLRILAREVGWNHVILGEIGLRIDDEEAYIEPWNPTRKIKYNPNVTSDYYKSLLEDLFIKNIRPSYIGIWSWNDNVYSIDSRRDILRILDSISINNNSYIVIIPSVKKQATAGANVSKPYNWVPIGFASIDPCLWGLEKFREAKVNGEAVMQIVNGILFTNTYFNLSQLKLKPWYVIGYNEVIFGVKPWGMPPYHRVPEKVLKLPIMLNKAPRIIAYTQYCIEKANTGLNLAYDIWIKRNNQTNGVGKGDVELMIWFYYSNVTPAGNIVGTITLDTLVNNSVKRIKWNVWVSSTLGKENRWTYIAITPNKPLKSCSEVAIDLTRVFEEVNIILKQYNISLNKMYLMSIELGTEIFYSKVVIVKWYLYKYILLVRKKYTNTVSNLLKVKYIADNISLYQNQNFAKQEIMVHPSGNEMGDFSKSLISALIILLIVLVYYAYIRLLRVVRSV